MPTQEEIRKRFLELKNQSNSGSLPVGQNVSQEQIRNRYQQLKGQVEAQQRTPQKNTLPAPKLSFLDFGKEFAKGIGKEAVSTVKSAGNFAKSYQKIPEPFRKIIPNLDTATKVSSFIPDIIGGTEKKLGLAEGQLTEPTNVPQKLGKYAGVGLEFLIPTSLEGRAIKEGAGLISAKNAERQITKAKKAYSKATDVLAPRVRDFEENTGKKIGDFLVAEQIPLEKNATKKGAVIDTYGALKTIGSRVNQMGKIQEGFLKTRPQRDINLLELQKKVLPKLDETYSNASELFDAAEDVSKFFKEEITRYGGHLVDGVTANRIKQGMWSLGYNSGKPTSKKTARIIGNTIKDHLEDVYKNEAGANIYKDLNKKMGEYLAAKIALGKGGLQGKTVRGGLLGRGINQIVGGVVGSKFGPLGSFVGAAGAGQFTDYLLNPERLTTNAVKLLKKQGKLPSYIKTVDEALDFIIKQQFKSPIGLPSPSFMYGSPPAKIKDVSGVIKNPRAPKVLPLESNRLLPSPNPQRAGPVIIPRPPTVFEPPAQKIGNIASPRTVSDRDFYGMEKAGLDDFLKQELEKVSRGISTEFPGQMEQNYDRFVSLVKNPKFLNPRAKEIIQSGDVESFKKLGSVKDSGIFDVGGSDDEVFDLFRVRLMREYPSVLGNFKNLLPTF